MSRRPPWPWLLAAIFVAGASAAMPAGTLAAGKPPSVVSTSALANGRYSYLVNGKDSLMIGMGYNPIYRYLPVQMRAANYQRDFRTLCQAGVNTITGWDTDKGYDQDKFDEITLDNADRYGIGVVMPIALPPDGDYEDPTLIGSLLRQAGDKVQRFKDHPALRMWGLGNEVLVNMPPDMHDSFLTVYLNLADMIHSIDPNHPVIYRDAEDSEIPEFQQLFQDSGDPRPWLLFGENIYAGDMDAILNRWPTYGLNRPVFVSEFGAEGATPLDRANGYANMWRTIRAHSSYVLGGAPYAWTTSGPEPTDTKWGLVDSFARPVDNTLSLLSQLWRQEPRANTAQCG